jgi:GNAT superfamily N-acetyltransferase
MRLATEKDLARIMAIKQDAVQLMTEQGNDQWDATYPTEETFIDYITKGYMYVLEIEGTIVGMMALVDYEDEEYKTVQWSAEGVEMIIHRLAVAKEATGKGYAKDMIWYAIDKAMKKNMDIIKLDTYFKNKKAQKLFMSMGFDFVGKIHFPQRDGEYYCYEMVFPPS